MDAATVTAITSNVDYATIVNGLGAIFGAVALVLIALRGGRMLMRAIGG